jgi:hypothetical protein
VFLLAVQISAWLRLSRRPPAWKDAEILLLRHQLAVLQRQTAARPRLTWTDRALFAVLLMWVPTTSSTSCDQVIFVDQATDVSLFSDAIQVEVDRLG